MSNIYSYQCLGLISGSSLDGLDIAHLEFSIQPDIPNPIQSWNFINGETVSFPDDLRTLLQSLPEGSALSMVEADNRLGSFFANAAKTFLGKIVVDFISSHGHTVFHHPGHSSTQIANPAIIAAKTNTQTIGHLRNMDTAYGGQGAPLAPMADLYLFPEYDVCINLGGIANISIKALGEIQGYDVCGANQFLNYLALQLGKAYDDEGRIARNGDVNSTLLQALNKIPYCLLPPPKSLDNQEVQSYYLPILKASTLDTPDLMATMVEHIAIQLTHGIPPSAHQIMVAGGGALNTFLIERIGFHLSDHTELIVPSNDIINFKEAALIAMCGGLRLHNLPNALKSFTGASKNSVNGVIFHP